MKPSSAAFIHSQEIETLHYPPDCPFKTERALMTKETLISMNLFTGENRFEEPPRAASMDELLLFHTESYLQTLQRVSKGDLLPEDLFLGLGSEDCPVFSDLYDYALLAAGATIRGAELILENKVQLAFNPSGGYHHAFSDRAGGFCYINDVVLGCKVLSNAGKKVLCLDLDAHHGNGTQDAFITDNSVFTISFHESGKTLFPWGGSVEEIGTGEGRGFNVNVPLPAGCDDDIFMWAFRDTVPKLLNAFKPDVIVVEIGMDILSVDPLTHLRMTNNSIADALPLIRDYGVPILAVGGGGYSPPDTARGWALAWSVLCDIEPYDPMSLGMGGVFLGSTEWDAGLRDMHSYTANTEKEQILNSVAASVDFIKKEVFPIQEIE